MVFLVSSFIRLFVFDLIPWLLEHVSHKSLEAEVASVRTATLAEDVQLSQSLLKLAAFFEFAEGPLPRSEVFFFQSRAHLILQGCSTIRGYQGCNAWWCLGLGSSLQQLYKHSWSMSENRCDLGALYRLRPSFEFGATWMRSSTLHFDSSAKNCWLKLWKNCPILYDFMRFLVRYGFRVEDGLFNCKAACCAPFVWVKTKHYQNGQLHIPRCSSLSS